MLKDDNLSMFDLSLMEHFYDPNYEKDENVINAWYIYVLKFLPLVNKKWREATTPDKIVNSSSMFHYITISDEALMRWFIQILLPNELKKIEKARQMILHDIEEINNDGYESTGVKNGQEDTTTKKPIKRGPHDTNVKATIYTALHHAITKARRNYNAAVRWNQIFWDEVNKRNETVLKNGSLSSKFNKVLNNAMDLPLPDLNENQEFLASYSITKGKDTLNEFIADDNSAAEEPTIILSI
jgi:hypothetical protein